MVQNSFAIRCPNCQAWNVWEQHPKELAINSAEELKGILGNLNQFSLSGREEDFVHPKLLRCQSSRSYCPASFTAFVGPNDAALLRYAEDVESWSLKRRFRLWKTSGTERWDNENEGKYYGVLFNTRPVTRLRYIEIESLIDHELIRRLISGMSLEIKAPLTIFVNKVFNPSDQKEEADSYWVPIEGYSDENEPVPPGFNHFCATCREQEMAFLRTHFEGLKITPKTCTLGYGKDGRCGGRPEKPACLREPSYWTHCPVFIETRIRTSACYTSDLEHLQNVVNIWQRGILLEYGLVHRCKAGFLEIAFPISVHGHLVGIVMTGQFFRSPDEIADPLQFINSYQTGLVEHKLAWESIRNSTDELVNAKYVLVGTELLNRANNKERFLIDPSDTRNRLRLLHDSVYRFQESAEAHYRDCRGKIEAAFRQELTGYILNHCSEQGFFGSPTGSSNGSCVGHILKRMQMFWAFKSAFLIHFTATTKVLSLLGMSILGETKGYGIPGEVMTKQMDIQFQDMHPSPYLHSDASPPPSDPRLKTLLPIAEKIVKDCGLELPKGYCKLIVLIPHQEEIFAFVFAIRNTDLVSARQSLTSHIVSGLCQDAILETCTGVAHMFDNVRPLVEWRYEPWNGINRDWKKREDCLKNNIRKAVENAHVSLNVLYGDLPQDEERANEWERSLSGIRYMLNKITSYL